LGVGRSGCFRRPGSSFLKALQGFTWLLVLQLAGEVLARMLRLPFPGPVIGMLLLMPALGWPALRAPVVEAARFLLAHLSLLFVPVGVGVVTHLDVLRAHGLRLALVIVLSTWAGLAVSALVLRALMRHAPLHEEPARDA
jgi:holin-like protein